MPQKCKRGHRSARLATRPVAVDALEVRRLLATITVNTTADTVAADGVTSLREAISASNASAAVLDTIVFSIGAGARTIRPNSSGLGQLPTISDPVILDGTAPAAFPTQQIELDGSLLTAAGSDGLRISAGDTVVRRLTINRFTGNGIVLESSGDNTIEGCRIGTDVTGTIARPNGDDGIDIRGTSNDNLIGGTAAGLGNLISGNGSDGVELGVGTRDNDFRGNTIGLNAAGTAALGNAGNGIRLNAAPLNTIGGTSAGAANVISGNGDNGIRISGNGANGNSIKGNRIGTNAAGTADLGNGGDGVSISASTTTERVENNLVGGTEAGAGNLISGNDDNGVEIGGLGTAISNRIEGNRIGTNAAGTAAVGNGLPGGTSGSGSGVRVEGGSLTVIGGTVAAARNVISGNAADGVRLEPGPGEAVSVLGNYIGTDAAGTAAVPNGNDGVHLRGVVSNRVGDAIAGAGNLISGNTDDGIEIENTSTRAAGFNTVRGNFIGTDAAGVAAIPNGSDGIEIGGARNNTIGGTTAAARNVISGNESDGIEVFATADGAATGNVIQGNFIGTQANGSSDRGNDAHGIYLRSGTTTVGGTAAGAGNVIAHNRNDGVFVEASSGNAILSNSIFSNGGLGVDLGPVDGVTPNDAAPDADAGPNTLQNFPVLSGAATAGASTTVSGTLDSAPSTTFTLQFFASPTNDAADPAEGRTPLAPATVSVTTNAAGRATFSVALSPAVPAGQFVTATATGPGNNTSEFSAAVAATGPAVVDRHVFYNNSAFDGNSAAVGAADDGAVAPDKNPLLPGGTATEANFTNYDKGINGVMVDVTGLPAASLSTADFEFRVGNNNTPSGWALAPAPLGIAVRDNAGVNGSDRVTIAWANGAIVNKWLQVTVKATAGTGLAAPDVFYFGNLAGDTFNSLSTDTAFRTNSVDLQRVRNVQFQTAPTLTDPESIFDMNKSAGGINSVDLQIVRNNQFQSINRIAVPIAATAAAAQSSPPAQPFLSSPADASSEDDDAAAVVDGL